jgi:hypothetical protein
MRLVMRENCIFFIIVYAFLSQEDSLPALSTEEFGDMGSAGLQGGQILSHT